MIFKLVLQIFAAANVLLSAVCAYTVLPEFQSAHSVPGLLSTQTDSDRMSQPEHYAGLSGVPRRTVVSEASD
jgi:hypothetical protein